jgi:hypothetical protein
MPQSIFSDLCDLVDQLERVTSRMEAGPVKDQLERLLEPFDALIDRTVGVEEPLPHDAD